MGWGIELRKTCLWMPTLLSEGEGHILAAVSARRIGIPRSRRAQHPSFNQGGKPYAREPNLQRPETSVLAALRSPAQEGEKPNLGMNGTEESESAPNPEHSTDEGAERGKAGPT